MTYKTLRQRKLIKALPKCKTLAEAGAKAGYSLTAGNLYKRSVREAIKRHVEITPEEIKRRFDELYFLCLDAQDYANANRANENRGKLAGLYKEHISIEEDRSQLCNIAPGDLLARIELIRATLVKKAEPDEQKSVDISPQKVDNNTEVLDT